jgi:hypothetical protein
MTPGPRGAPSTAAVRGSPARGRMAPGPCLERAAHTTAHPRGPGHHHGGATPVQRPRAGHRTVGNPPHPLVRVGLPRAAATHAHIRETRTAPVHGRHRPGPPPSPRPRSPEPGAGWAPPPATVRASSRLAPCLWWGRCPERNPPGRCHLPRTSTTHIQQLPGRGSHAPRPVCTRGMVPREIPGRATGD